MLAHWFPGVGDPWELTARQWDGLLDRIADIMEMESGRNHRAYIERMQRRRNEDA